jgi:CheY-like chemotaxis protein
MDEPGNIDILLVEDNPADAELAMHALASSEPASKVAWVQDGVAALDFIFRRGAYATRPDHHPRVILLDLKLPKVDGMEVLKQLKENASTRAIPVVMLTSSGEKRDINASYQLGVNSYVVKPVEFEEYSHTLEHAGSYWTRVNTVP